MPDRPDHLRRLREFAALLVLWMLVMYGLSILGMPRAFTPLSFRYLHINRGVFGLLNFALFYTAIRLVFPQFLEHRKWGRLAAGLILLLAVATLAKFTVADHFFRDEVLLLGSRDGKPLYKTFWMYVRTEIWTNAIVLCAALAYVLFFAWLAEDKRRKQLALQKQDAEFAILKMQLNAHFLMNSLNSIYSLALVRSPQVVVAAHTLSQILEYMTEQPPVAGYRTRLSDELRYLEDFIAMQRLRTGCQDCVRMRVSGDPAAFGIAPLLLVPFVENAFKHGVANRPEQPVEISVDCSGEGFGFTVRNFKTRKRKDQSGGIGLVNVRKRLELVYPGQYELTIRETEQEYSSHLQIHWENGHSMHSGGR
ncbi:sensor histidine kinase [Chitinophaga rhizosphaerae]|uniref:sensor histidine kinase n=1 Tax=Chitinophaga rhizosphaerae TaxID=1864947 RepID=UPI000F7FCFEA|nr:histidine kinase [Chitinophaga rhizosphaerae]